jgi:hypothetical protein
MTRKRASIRSSKSAKKPAREAARYKSELDASRAPRPAPAAAAPSTDAAPDAADSAKYPGGEYDPKFLKDQARYEARQEFREQHAAQQAADEDTRRERDFDTRASSFVTRLKDANAVEAIDRRLLSGKPLSLLTSKERAEIAKLPQQEQHDLGFICFLAEQWDGSEHDIDAREVPERPEEFSASRHAAAESSDSGIGESRSRFWCCFSKGTRPSAQTISQSGEPPDHAARDIAPCSSRRRRLR